ncbi:MAG TPA: TIGR03668 family PPOX class F420-dependent oxidoreductase [Jiangellaceae bacterium]|nr:TIGR03668 family PPOX class F420-dependent oxidoreductase [Jiangellaceae bacterium]
MRLDETTCRDRMAASRVARLATASMDGRPHVVPITFAVRGDVIVTAVDQKPKSTTRLRRLRNVVENPRVSVLADHYSDDWITLWWVRADGRAEIVEDATARRVVVADLAAKYEQYRDDPPAGPVMLIAVESWTGWST